MAVQRNRRQVLQLGQIVFLGDVLVLGGFQLIDNVSGRVNVNFVVNRIQNQVVVVFTCLVTSLVPTIAGSSRERAMIEVWEVRPPDR